MTAQQTERRPQPLVAGGGCAAKMGPGSLARLLGAGGLTASVPGPDTLNLLERDVLVGPQTGDDAAVVRLTDDLAIIQTVDFFPPVVADPETFGAIAATNAMSDVFAMGGEVLTALSHLTVPDGLDVEVGAAVLRGASAAVRAAGGRIVGGHTILDPTLIFGMSITGRVHPGRVWARSTAQPGDVLYLTKPLGTALLLTAHRAGAAAERDVEEAVASMLQLNLTASRLIATTRSPSAVTDVTGFGLLGHVAEMVDRSGVGAEIDASATPLLAGARAAATAGYHCAGLYRNRDYWLDSDGQHRVAIVFTDQVNDVARAVLFDPQTSGGLLISMPEEHATALERAFATADERLWRIGRLTPESGIRVEA